MPSDLKISIILPVFNSEKYLRKCINSIINQTYTNWELIIINDGSSDSSRNICNEFSKDEQRISVIHKLNEGVSKARNIGLELCSGDYVTFVDSDDYLEPFTLYTYIKEIKKNNSDIIKVGYYREYKNKKQECVAIDENVVLYNTWDLYRLLEKSHYYSFLWNMCIKKTCISDIKFDENIFWCEDHIFSYQCYLNCKKMSILSIPCYHYIIHESCSLSDIKDPYVIKIANEKERESKLLLNGGVYADVEKEIEDCYSYRLHRILYILYNYKHPYTERHRFSKECKIWTLKYKEDKIFFSNSLPFFLKDIILKMFFLLKKYIANLTSNKL